MDEQAAVHEATVAFYAALQAVLDGRGLEGMRQVWHHDDEVSAAHPMGDWAHGWDAVWQSWEALAAIAAIWKVDGRIGDVHTHVHGDFAYATGIYQSVVQLEHRRLELRLNCTNVLRRDGGRWKIVHHHADAASELVAALTEAAEQAHR
jgi:ketosteroid isomerase-like protein